MAVGFLFVAYAQGRPLLVSRLGFLLPELFQRKFGIAKNLCNLC